MRYGQKQSVWNNRQQKRTATQRRKEDVRRQTPGLFSSLLFSSLLFSSLLLLTACTGNGGAAYSDGSVYNPDGTPVSSSGSGPGSSGSSGGSSESFTAQDLMELANAGDAEGIIRRVTSNVVSSPETCTVSMTAADLDLPAGGSVRLVISGIGYDETVTADADGNVSFVVPLIAVDSTVTVELSVMGANGTLLWYGSKTEQVSDGFNLDITLTGQAGALPVTVDKTVLTATATSAELATITITGATETPLLTPSSSLLNTDPPVQDASDPETYTVSVGIPGGTAPVWFADDTAVSVTVTVGTEEYTIAFTLKNKYTVEVQYASPTGSVDAAEIGTFLQGSSLAFSTVSAGASSMLPAGREAVAFEHGSSMVLYKNASGGATSVTISSSSFSGLTSRTIILEPVLDFTCSRSDGGYGTTASPLSSQTGTSTNPYLLNYYGTDTNKHNQIELEISDNKCTDSALTIGSAQTAIVSATFDITHTGNKFLIKIKPTLAENSVYTSDTIKLTITDPATGAKKDIHVLLKKNLPVVTMKTGSQISSILTGSSQLDAGTGGVARSFAASTTPPPSGVTTYELSAADSEGQCLAWLDGTSIKYYAKGYTDASPVRKIPLNANSSYMFMNCSSLTSIDMSGFDTSSVTDMRSMFENCSGLTSLNVSDFNTSSVTSMRNMFENCSGLANLNLSGLDTSRVTDMTQMFYNCSNLTGITGLSGFNTDSVTSMNNMFSGCSGLTSLDVSNFNTSTVTDMSYMFRGCSMLTTIYASAAFDTASVTNSNNMFYNCTNLRGGNGTTFSSSYTTKARARIDGGASNPGYFTAAP